jgi:predicted XRE-type DNA-binding protein
MKSEQMEVVRGSGNVFRDFGHEQADVERFKAILAAEIIKVLDREGLSVRGAHSRTGIAAAYFFRIRNADLGRFTLDRLVSIINRLASRIEIKVKVRRTQAAEYATASHGGRSDHPL